MFMEEAYNAAICFKMFRDMSDSDPLHLKYIIKKIKNMARRSPNLVLETIHDYFTDNPEISNRHKFRLFRALESVIEATDFLEEIWKETFMQLALENMTKSTELEDGYQDAASDVLVAICRHSWRTVAQYLETELLTGVFPHRSLLYVMGVLTSDDGVLTQEDRAGWEEQVTQVPGAEQVSSTARPREEVGQVGRVSGGHVRVSAWMAVNSVPFLNTDVWSKELLRALTKPSQTHQEQSPEKVGPTPRHSLSP
ncbi:HEAT repeat-containing protein 7A [Tupaia chinensis]|uniref:HEAT repeat-containing protein 7A n=1 Tax=Tupaia chinensis TaxID=246437 RepID=L9KLT3_TUPCH|nr:HEAT repeat-containing protein 7A [Tupaia chinensis]